MPWRAGLMSWGMGQCFFNKRFVASERNFISEFVNYSIVVWWSKIHFVLIPVLISNQWFELCVGKLTVLLMALVGALVACWNMLKSDGRGDFVLRSKDSALCPEIFASSWGLRKDHYTGGVSVNCWWVQSSGLSFHELIRCWCTSASHMKNLFASHSMSLT